jgi:hypothetical protein
MSTADRQTEHPDLAAIEAVRTGEGTEADRQHVEACVPCQAMLKDLDTLAAELRPLAAPPFAVPGEIDRQILWNARKQAAVAKRQARGRRALPYRATWAAAASVVLAIGALSLWQRTQREGIAPAVRTSVRLAAQDVNGDGRLDILDAFALARTVEAGAAPGAPWDVNADHRVDRRDVDAIARQAVALKEA